MGNREVGHRRGRAALAAASAFGAILSLGFAEAARAEEEPRSWIATNLRVNLRRGAGAEYKVIGSLAANDPVTVLDEEEGWTMVQLEGGKTGWIPAGYLTSEPPAAIRVEQLESELTEVRAELARTAKDGERLREENRTVTTREAEQRDRLNELEAQTRELRAKERWRDWVVGAGILALGMVSGAILFRASNRRRSTRLRI